MRKTLFALFVGILSLMVLTTSCGGGTIPSPTTITSPSKPIPEMGKQRLEERAQGLMNALFDGRVTDLNSFASESERLSLDQQTKAIEELAAGGTLREGGYQFELTESSLSSDQQTGEVRFTISTPAIPESSNKPLPIRIQFAWKNGDYFFTIMETGVQDQARLALAKVSMGVLRTSLTVFYAESERTYPASVNVSTGDPLVPIYLDSRDWDSIKDSFLEFSYSLLADGSYRMEGKAKDWNHTLLVATPAGLSP